MQPEVKSAEYEATIIVRSPERAAMLRGMHSSSHSVVVALVLVLAGLTAVPSLAQDSAKPKVPAKLEKQKTGKSIIQQKAEKIMIPLLEFADADIDECLTYLRKKSQECDTDPDPNKRGLSILNRTPPGSAKPVTISLKNVSVWDAIHKIVAAAGVEVSMGGVGGNAIVIHPKGAGPIPQPADAAYIKSALWLRAEKIVIDRAMFDQSSAAEVCAFLNVKSKEADKAGKGVEFSAAGELKRTVTMDLRKVRLTDFISAVAEVIGAKITVAEEKIILKPARKAKD